MSNLWISAHAVYVPGPQAQTVTESQKAASVYAVSSLNYTLTANAQTVTESQKATNVYAVASFNYA